MPIVGKAELMQRVLRGIEASGWRWKMQNQNHPFRIAAFDQESRTNLVVYVWNITHGGGAARPEDEYRIQLTGVTPPLISLPDGPTLLMGWSEDWTLFAAFDARLHSRFSERSPSIQFRREVIDTAIASGVALHRRSNGEVVVVFRPEFLMTYAMNRDGFHAGSLAVVRRRQAVIEQISRTVEGIAVPAPPDAEIVGRDRIIKAANRALRDGSFKNRVLRAYGYACALCGMQFDVIDAAHIVPVERLVNFSTRNGLCMCPNHHRAYDKGLIVVEPSFSITVDQARLAYYKSHRRAEGEENLLGSIFRHLRVPANPLEQPAPNLLKLGMEIRREN